jgi:hypothetical protein
MARHFWLSQSNPEEIQIAEMAYSGCQAAEKAWARTRRQ